MGKEREGGQIEKDSERARAKETERQGETEPQTGRETGTQKLGSGRRHRDAEGETKGQRKKRPQRDIKIFLRPRDHRKVPRDRGLSSRGRHTMTFVPQAAQSWLEKHIFPF